MQNLDSTETTLNHINRVRELLATVRHELSDRGKVHDLTKLQSPEKEGFDRLMALDLSGLKYGTDEYKAALAREKPAIEHHYKNNSHHPEFYPGGVTGMSLIDVIEMLADWKAAGERMKPDPEIDSLPGERLRRSIDHNVKRFNISEQLASILHNTAFALGW